MNLIFSKADFQIENRNFEMNQEAQKTEQDDMCRFYKTIFEY